MKQLTIIFVITFVASCFATTKVERLVGDFLGDGLLASAVSFGFISSVVVDSKNNIYVAGRSIRVMNASTGLISVIQPAPGVIPNTLFMDRVNDVLYIGDIDCKIFTMNLKTKVISHIGGNGTCFNSGDGGLAVNASFGPLLAFSKFNDLIYAQSIDGGGHTQIRVINGSGFVNTLTGSVPITFWSTPAVNGLFSVISSDVAGIDAFDPLAVTLTRTFGSIAGDQLAEGIPAVNASFLEIQGLAVDDEGNIYVVEIQNQINVVRKIEITTGIVNTIAGNFSISRGISAGDGGLATLASFQFATFAIVDSNFNVYIADAFTLRKVDFQTKIINAFAGNGFQSYSGDGLKSALAQIASMSSVFQTENGDVYFTDEGNNAIRKITAATGIITSVAGNGIKGNTPDGALALNGSLFAPQSVVLDKSGNIFFSESGRRNTRNIRKIDAKNGTIETIANGITVTQFTLDEKGNIYYCDSSRRLFVIDSATLQSTQISSVLEASLVQVFNEFLYVAQFGVIRYNLTGGDPVVIAGNGTNGVSVDGIPAVNSPLSQVTGMALDAEGSVYVSLPSEKKVKKIDAKTGILSTVVGNGLDFTEPGLEPLDTGLSNPGPIFYQKNLNTLLISDNNARLLGYVDVPVVPDGPPVASGVNPLGFGLYLLSLIVIAFVL